MPCIFVYIEKCLTLHIFLICYKYNRYTYKCKCKIHEISIEWAAKCTICEIRSHGWFVFEYVFSMSSKHF